MSNWYISREHVKLAGNLSGEDNHRKIDRVIESASRSIDARTHRFFIPKTATRLYRWPPLEPSRSITLWLDQGLISVTTLQTQAQNSSPTTISPSDYFLEPNNQGPPYDRIEIDQSSAAAFESGDTPQRSISIAGSWGYAAETESVGTVSSGLDSDATATSMVCSDASLIDVGDTLLIESEQIFVSGRSFSDIGKNLNGALTADVSENVTLEALHGAIAGETLQVDSEQMLILGTVSANVLRVIRGFNGTQIAAHSDATDVFVSRTLTIERGANGTTGATHANATAISKYVPPFDIRSWCLAEAVAMYHQESAGWGRTIGGGEAAVEMSGRELASLRKVMCAQYGRMRTGVV